MPTDTPVPSESPAALYSLRPRRSSVGSNLAGLMSNSAADGSAVTPCSESGQTGQRKQVAILFLLGKGGLRPLDVSVEGVQLQEGQMAAARARAIRAHERAKTYRLKDGLPDEALDVRAAPPQSALPSPDQSHGRGVEYSRTRRGS